MMHGKAVVRTVLCGALALMPWWAGAQQMGFPPAAVVVDEVRRTEISPTVSIPGTVVSRADSRLATEVEGRVTWFADVGTVVAQGDPVVRLESTTLEIQRDEYRGQVERERGRLTFLEPEVDRLEILAAESNAAESLLDQTRSNLEVARGDLAVAEARLRQVEDQIAKMTIVAPFDGVVSERSINPGEFINRLDEVIRLVSPDSIEVTARAPLNAVAFLEAGAQLPIYNDYRRGPGTVRAIVTFGDPQSHMFELRIDVPAEQWIVGESVRVDVPTEAPKQALVVPRDALVLRREGAFVFRVGPEQRAQRVPVMPGVGDGNLIEVDGALAAGDVIVIRGAERLMEGQPVQVTGS
ncbi:MAG: efflux RND transporter periplasmic adaptor subunit [Rhodospirillaceae bacterium]|nr:efflux RND transporter periplasmic adaptor subunit [Rhodospirillaceae bacterium]